MCIESKEGLTHKGKETKTCLGPGICEASRTLSLTCFCLGATHHHASMPRISNLWGDFIGLVWLRYLSVDQSPLGRWGYGPHFFVGEGDVGVMSKFVRLCTDKWAPPYSIYFPHLFQVSGEARLSVLLKKEWLFIDSTNINWPNKMCPTLWWRCRHEHWYSAICTGKTEVGQDFPSPPKPRTQLTMKVALPDKRHQMWPDSWSRPLHTSSVHGSQSYCVSRPSSPIHSIGGGSHMLP